MKKLVSILLVAVFAIAIMATGAFATEGAKFVFSKGEGTVGSTVDITVSLENNPGIISGAVFVNYDHDGLELKEITLGIFTAKQLKTAKAGYSNFDPDGKPLTGDGVIATYTFEIKKASETPYEITCVASADDSFISSDGFEYILPTVTAGSITVKAAETPHTCVYDQEVVDAKFLKSEATCKQAAVYYKSCSTCGEYDKSEGAATFTSGDIDSTKHEGTLGTEWKSNENSHWYEYSCCGAKVDEADHTCKWRVCTDGDGCEHDDCNKHESVCTVCGEVLAEHEAVWDDGVVTTPATDTEEGVKTYTCTECGLTKEEKIKATGGGTGGGTGGTTGGGNNDSTKPSDDGKKDDNTGKKDDGKKAPKTGDESDLVLWASVLLVACGAAVVVVTKKKHN